ncbi:MAG: glycosyltransferase [Candidatus Omnitrophica bacterium]|nr:glycosyltransferase [Candidatus Omnitrophota bacterium]
MKVALVHDWLTGMRGGEKVLEVLCELFPQSQIFTLLHKKGTLSSTIEGMPIKTSFLQFFPSIEQNYRNYLPFFPLAIESFDFKGFDLIISSSHCVAKAAKAPKGAKHFCYCHAPMRYVWNFFDQYFGAYPAWKKGFIKFISKDLRRWDRRTVARVDEFIANSETVRKRIRDIYNRKASVIYPPVDVEQFTIDTNVKRGDFYLCVSALVPYKRIGIVIDAFNEMRDKRLIIVGDGNSRSELEKRKISDNISFKGWVKPEDLLSLYRKARAFVYAAEEDFGIAPVEAQAAGLPVIAYGAGGVSETVIPLNGTYRRDAPTGVFFFEQKPEALIAAIEEFERREKELSPILMRQNALRFSRESFKNNIREFLEKRVGKI